MKTKVTLTKTVWRSLLNKRGAMDSNKTCKLDLVIPKELNWCESIREVATCYKLEITTQPICDSKTCNKPVNYTIGREYNECCSVSCSKMIIQQQPEQILTKKNYEGFLSKDGKIHRSKWLKIPDDHWASTISELLVCYKNNITKQPKCAWKKCNELVNFSKDHYNNTCSNSCSTKLQHNSLDQDSQEAKDKRLYYNECWKYTNRNDLGILPNIEKRGKYKGDFHLDHIYPMSKGLENGRLPYTIGELNNLQVIPMEENIRKGSNL